jgi:hypothetical protein
MQNDIQILNDILFLSLKEEIENLGDESIYIPNLTITFNIQIEISDKNTEFAKIETREIKPPSLKNKILVEYIIEELQTRLKEDIEKAIEKNLYNKILETQGYYSGNLNLTEKINTLLIDKKDIIVGDSEYSILAQKNNTNILNPIYKAIHSFNIYIQLTLKEIMQKIMTL